MLSKQSAIPPEPILYETVFRALAENGVQYLTVGGVAVNLHGFHRYTHDLDLIIHLDVKNVEKFIQAVKPLGFRPRVPVPIEDLADEHKRTEWQKEKGALVFGLDNSKNHFERIDVFLESPIDFKTAYHKRRVLTLRNIKINLISIDDLVFLKKKASRPIDETDISALKKIASEMDEK